MSNNDKILLKYPPFFEEFKEWCIKKGYTKKTADTYLSNIRAAYDNFCYWHKGLFEGIENAFNSVISKESEDLIETECWVEGLDDYIDDLGSFKNGISIEGRKEDYKDAPVTEWINSFKKYREFLFNKLQGLKHEIIGDAQPEIELPYKFPLKREFTKYLREWKFPEATIWTYNSRLNKCFKVFFNKFVWKDFIDKIPDLIADRNSLELISQKIEGMKMILMTEKDFREKPELQHNIKEKESHVTIQDLKHAIKALEQYEFFLKDKIKNTEKRTE